MICGMGLGVRVDVNGEVKFLRKIKQMGGGEGVGFGGRVGGQGGCERRIEVFEKIKKIRVGGQGGGSGGAVGLVGVGADVNAILGVGVIWGMGDVNKE